MRYYINYGTFRPSYKEISFREAQRIMGSLRNGSCDCSKGCCTGSYDNLAQFAAVAKQNGHKEIYLDPAGPRAYAQ